jgi:hypothetical protein
MWLLRGHVLRQEAPHLRLLEYQDREEQLAASRRQVPQTYVWEKVVNWPWHIWGISIIFGVSFSLIIDRAAHGNWIWQRIRNR